MPNYFDLRTHPEVPADLATDRCCRRCQHRSVRKSCCSALSARPAPALHGPRCALSGSEEGMTNLCAAGRFLSRTCCGGRQRPRWAGVRRVPPWTPPACCLSWLRATPRWGPDLFFPEFANHAWPVVAPKPVPINIINTPVPASSARPKRCPPPWLREDSSRCDGRPES